MDTYINYDGDFVITLSKRNLLSLLSKVDDPNSARTLYKRTELGVIRVVSEDDATHYGSKTPGPMSKETEDYIKSHSRVKEAP